MPLVSSVYNQYRDISFMHNIYHETLNYYISDRKGRVNNNIKKNISKFFGLKLKISITTEPIELPIAERFREGFRLYL